MQSVPIGLGLCLVAVILSWIELRRRRRADRALPEPSALAKRGGFRPDIH